MTKRILIEGMSCKHCLNHVKEALSKLNGVISIEVDLTTKSAVLETAVDVSDEDIKEAIDDAGYDVLGIEVM